MYRASNHVTGIRLNVAFNSVSAFLYGAITFNFLYLQSGSGKVFNFQQRCLYFCRVLVCQEDMSLLSHCIFNWFPTGSTGLLIRLFFILLQLQSHPSISYN